MSGMRFAVLISLALRNLSRHTVKTVITVGAITISVSLYIFMDAWLLGMNLDSRRNIVMYEIGAAKIQRDSYYDKKEDLPMYESFTEWKAIGDKLERAGYQYSPRFVFSATVHSKTASAPLVVNGVDLERDRALLKYLEYISFGREPQPGTREVVVGAMLAERLHVGIPERPTREEFEQDLLGMVKTDEEREFIQGLYEPEMIKVNKKDKKKGLFSLVSQIENEQGRLRLKRDASPSDVQRLWIMLAETGRMNIRLQTTIDMKALPERILAERFTRDIEPLYIGGNRQLLERVYKKDPVIDEYYLIAEDKDAEDRVLEVLLASDYQGVIRHVNQIIDSVVVGVISSPNPQTNGHVAYMPLDGLQDEAGLMLNGAVTEILVRSATADDSRLPGNFEKPESIMNGLGSLPEDLSVRSWDSYTQDYLAASAQDEISSRIMIVFLFVLSFMGIANTMLMAILERTKETGMIRSLGMTDGEILFLYGTEAACIGVIGSAIGVIVGCLINIPMVRYGIDYSAVTNAMSGDIGYRIATHFRSAWNVPSILITFFGGSIISGLIALPPTIRALKLPVTESLRFE